MEAGERRLHRAPCSPVLEQHRASARNRKKALRPWREEGGGWLEKNDLFLASIGGGRHS